MAKRNVSNLLGLAVLSLLTERPMHPYEMSAIMRQRDVSSAIKLNQSSLYSVIEALQREDDCPRRNAAGGTLSRAHHLHDY